MSHPQAKTPLRVTIIGYAVTNLGLFGREDNEASLLTILLVLALEVWPQQSRLDSKDIKLPCLSLLQRYVSSLTTFPPQPY